MPMFEYRCGACEAQFEELTSRAEADAVTCRRCGSSAVTRLLSAFAVGGATAAAPVPEPGPCGSCGAAQRGMCAMD
ncbi:MAG: zinc ribbon domain-containing protein [Candidatus Binatia bacterium]